MVFGTDTPAGKLFDVVLLWAIILSVLGVMLESVKSLKIAYFDVFYYFEWTFTIIFTFEYLLRLFISKNPKGYALSFFGIIDFLALLPSYIGLFVVGGSYLLIIRSIRLLRVFRILKLGRYLREASVLSDALIASRHKILVFLGAVLTIALVMGTLMYMVEGSESGFTSIPRSIYWSIVTITTVGYGDIAPSTIPGQMIASVLMLMGYAIIAVPTGIVTAELTQAEKKKKEYEKKKRCSRCQSKGHKKDAVYCRICGQML
ncbi:MAG: ion transporter [Bacteroidota bacterium]